MTGLFLLQLLGVYGLIQVFVTGGVIPQTTWDQLIPLMPVFLIPYVMYYPLLVVPFWIGLKDKSSDRMFAVATTFFLAASICNLIYVLFPTTMSRPEVVGSGVFAEALRWLYSVDGSVALLPSAHVTYSLLANLMTWSFNKSLGYALFPVTVLIIMSTVLIKQHYILDVLAGIAVAVGVYWFMFRYYFAV
jgi:membrane-associated phospholipid phosphatase